MNNRERVLATLEHRQPDHVPYSIGFTQKMHARMANYLGDPKFASKIENCFTVLGCEPAGGWKEVRPDVRRDQFGVEWDVSVDKDIGVVCNRVVTPENVKNYPLPDPDDPSRYAGYAKATADKRDMFVVVNHGFSLYERAWTMTGMEAFMEAMIDDPGFANTLLDRILEFNLRIIKRACAHDIDAIMFGDDWGQQRGLQMGPRLWREFIKPRIRKMYGLARSKGKHVIIHSCGKVDGIFPDLIECGLNVFNPFQPEVMDVFEMKRRFGKALSFYGGISTQKTLPYGTVAEVKDEVKRLITEIGKDGGYFASPAHAIPGDAKPENVAAMIEVLQNQ